MVINIRNQRNLTRMKVKARNRLCKEYKKDTKLFLMQDILIIKMSMEMEIYLSIRE